MVRITGEVRRHVVRPGIGLVGHSRPVCVGRVRQRAGRCSEIGATDRSRAGNLGSSGIGQWTGPHGRCRRGGLVNHDRHGTAVTCGMVRISGEVRRHVIRSGVGLVGNSRPVCVGRVRQRAGRGAEIGPADRSRAGGLGIAGIGQRTGPHRRYRG